ncbi:MAG: hypothetical protein Q7U57_05425 [Methylovulum sp.]|nr:hypothetical protein [Methylovulum sp.]
MKTQTKCTLIICGLFIVEILPVPFTSLYSLYAIRKRPDWLPKLVDSLYADKPVEENTALAYSPPGHHDPMATRRKYTFILAAMFMVDLLIPVVIPAALFIALKRPIGFKKLVAKLYADKLQTAAPNPLATHVELIDPKKQAELEQRLADLELTNMAFAQSLAVKMQTTRPLSIP